MHIKRLGNVLYQWFEIQAGSRTQSNGKAHRLCKSTRT